MVRFALTTYVSVVKATLSVYLTLNYVPKSCFIYVYWMTWIPIHCLMSLAVVMTTEGKG